MSKISIKEDSKHEDIDHAVLMKMYAGDGRWVKARMRSTTVLMILNKGFKIVDDPDGFTLEAVDSINRTTIRLNPECFDGIEQENPNKKKRTSRRQEAE